MSDQAQGKIFEVLETIKFNYDALKKDSRLYAQTTASMGLPHDPVDIIIRDGKKTVAKVQAKSCTVPKTAFAISNKKYQGMDRLVPKDQGEKIDKLIKQRIAKVRLKAEDYKDAASNLFKQGLEHDNVMSPGTTRNEVLKMTDPENAKKFANTYKFKASMVDMHESGKIAGKRSAAIKSGLTVVKEFYSFTKGKKEIGDILANTAIEAVKGYASGYTLTALSKGITHASSQFLSSSAAKMFIKSNAPTAIAANIIAASKSFVAYLKGEIESDQLLDEISHTAITGTASFYYGAVGQIAIPIPIIGAAVETMVEYLVGNMLHQSGLISLGEAPIVKAAKARRKHIEAMCISLIPKIRQEREILEQTINQYFKDREKIFSQAFKTMDIALAEFDPDKFVSALENINNQFGKTLQFKTFEEFDKFMESDEPFEF